MADGRGRSLGRGTRRFNGTKALSYAITVGIPMAFAYLSSGIKWSLHVGMLAILVQLLLMECYV